jgi:hypothetical protein
VKKKSAAIGGITILLGGRDGVDETVLEKGLRTREKNKENVVLDGVFGVI